MNYLRTKNFLQMIFIPIVENINNINIILNQMIN
jgi:hypothetical protein